MEFLKNIRNIDSISHLIKVSSKKYNEYVLYTYTVKDNKKYNEDELYKMYPDLIVLSRAFSILTHNDNIITILEGPRKFGGRTLIDDDDSYSCDSSLIDLWYNSNELEIIETEKANGKFAILKILDNDYILFGSKNSHHLVNINDPINFGNNIIVQSIFNDIKNNYTNLLQLKNYFNNGYSLVGELCDGQHFTKGDNTIKFFGLFKNGFSHDSITTFNILKSLNIKCVDFTLIKDYNSLDEIYLRSRCKKNEGSVLYFRNVKTNDSILIKSKSATYIIKRFLREILKRGYMNIGKLRNRFIDAKDYHNLNTETSIVLTKLLFNFALWMMESKYPSDILGHQQGYPDLANGFNYYWEQFLINTNTIDPELTPDNFGTFDVNEYLRCTSLYEERDYNNLIKVVFLQGVQGSGKSTIASQLVEHYNSIGIKATYIEQDFYYGHSDSCKGALYHAIMENNKYDLIILSRCNVNEKQYQHYLDLVHSLPTRVIFISPNNVNTLYYTLGLIGVIERSSDKNYYLGKSKLALEDISNIIFSNKIEEPNCSYKIDTIIDNQELVNELDTIISEGKLLTYINENINTLKSHRVCIDKIVRNYINCINSFDKLLLPTNPIYIGMAVNENDKLILNNFVNQFVKNENYVMYNHHCTQLFLGKKSVPTNIKLVKPNETVNIIIDALVIRKSDNASAYRINFIDGYTLKHTPHITAKLPQGVPPNESNSFVGLVDDTVEIISCDFKLILTGFWR